MLHSILESANWGGVMSGGKGIGSAGGNAVVVMKGKHDEFKIW